MAGKKGTVSSKSKGSKGVPKMTPPGTLNGKKGGHTGGVGKLKGNGKVGGPT